MTRRRTLGLAAIATAVAVPTAIVVAGGGSAVTDDVNQQTTKWTGRHTAPADWKTVPGVGSLSVANEGHAVIVSADIARGKAKFRVKDDGQTLPPGPALFAAKGGNSFSWAYADGCDPDPEPVLEWKRVGRGKTIASRISTVNLHSGLPCL